MGHPAVFGGKNLSWDLFDPTSQNYFWEEAERSLSLCLVALEAVPAPEILRIWSGILRPRDSHIGVGLAFCTNFHLAAHRVNPLR